MKWSELIERYKVESLSDYFRDTDNSVYEEYLKDNYVFIIEIYLFGGLDIYIIGKTFQGNFAGYFGHSNYCLDDI